MKQSMKMDIEDDEEMIEKAIRESKIISAKKTGFDHF